MQKVDGALRRLPSMKTILPLLLFLLSSCGTIMSPGPFVVPVSSEPPGAVVRYNNGVCGKTPCIITMTRGVGTKFQLELDGYHTMTCDAGDSFNGWVLGNVIFGGVIGLVVDSISGSFQNIDTSPLNVPLIPTSEPNVSLFTRSKTIPLPDPTTPADGWHTMTVIGNTN